MKNNDLLEGWAAFETLEHLLNGEPLDDVLFEEPLFQRIQAALRDQPRSSPLDLAVLIRQVLRFQTEQLGSRPATLRINRQNQWVNQIDWTKVGVVAKSVQDHLVLEAQPWTPNWLANVDASGVDGAAAGMRSRRHLQEVRGDPFLTDFERTYYLSPGQRSAVRATLTTPPGATLLICLPTGEGKSFIFQVLAKYGFDDSPPGPGVTLVVTPTVMLALDQERAARELGFDPIPRAYVGGDKERNEEMVERIANGTQGLCFASPEAVCGRLRPALLQAARNLYLRALIIDEAHLVDTWGSNFRPEFQLLSGVRHDLLQAVGGGQRFRTFLLSATLTGETVTTLQKLFSPASDDSSHFAVCTAARLRPEVDYWVSKFCDQSVQQQRTLEAIYHLPRPAILYLTKVKEQAEWWYRKLKQEGFGRLVCVTGSTRDEERRRAIKQWKAREIDLVVATSAFGLGIDNAEVRTIIHACVPETLDRFYQEVGRGGRDGRASISLIIPTGDDLNTARFLNQNRLISVERGFQRWQAMFEHPSCEYQGEDIFSVRLDVPPGNDEKDIDMVGEESTRWHARTVALMANAGLITLHGLGAVADDNGLENDPVGTVNWHPVQTIKVRHPSHLDPEFWQTMVEPERQRLKSAFDENLNRLKQHLNQTDCIANTVAPLYEVYRPEAKHSLIPVAKACGGCPHCRQHGKAAWQDPPLGMSPPWIGRPVNDPVVSLLELDQRLIVFCPTDFFNLTQANLPRREKRRFYKILSALINSGVRNVLLLPGVDLDLGAIQKEVRWLFFVSDSLVAHQLPPGPSLVLAPLSTQLMSQELQRKRQPHQARIYFLDEGFRDPLRPEVLFSQTNRGRQIRLEELQRSVL